MVDGVAYRFEYNKDVLGRPVKEKRYLGESPTMTRYSQGVVDRFAMAVFNQPTGINGDFGLFTNKKHGKEEIGRLMELLQNGPFGFGIDGAEPKTSAQNSSNIG